MAVRGLRLDRDDACRPLPAGHHTPRLHPETADDEEEDGEEEDNAEENGQVHERDALVGGAPAAGDLARLLQRTGAWIRPGTGEIDRV